MIAEQLSLYDYTDKVLKNLSTVDVHIKAKNDNIQKAETQIELLHSSDDGFITVAVKKDKQWVQYHYKKEDLKNNIGKVLSIENIDIYLSPNSFYRPVRRIENVRKLNSLYIDLDYYTLENLKRLNTDQIIWQLENDYFNTEIPEASFIVITGRGVAIYWLIEPVPYKALPLWNAVQKNFLSKLKSIGADEKSIDAARVMRLSGSVNQKNSIDTDLVIYSNNNYNLRNLQEEYLPELTPYVKNPYHKAPGRKKKVVNLFTLYSLHYARLRDLVELVELREGYCRMEDGTLKETGQREFICFLYRYWSCCYEGNNESALKSTLDFNKSFKNPLKESEVIKATKSAERAYSEWLKESPSGIYKRGGYNYKNTTLIELLNITEEEERNLITIISTKEKRNRYNYKRREQRIEQRQEERKAMDGLTKKQYEKKKRQEKVKKLKKEGLSVEAIAEKLEINIRTVYRDLKNN
ncbi:DNA-binding response regulator [Clostridium botulinum]|uniref:DNA-binding response regulator n=1 Tax=Clostridium botulinum TaxID=1491 RepID=UPI003DA3690A